MIDENAAQADDSATGIPAEQNSAPVQNEDTIPASDAQDPAVTDAVEPIATAETETAATGTSDPNPVNPNVPPADFIADQNAEGTHPDISTVQTDDSVAPQQAAIPEPDKEGLIDKIDDLIEEKFEKIEHFVRKIIGFAEKEEKTVEDEVDHFNASMDHLKEAFTDPHILQVIDDAKWALQVAKHRAKVGGHISFPKDPQRP